MKKIAHMWTFVFEYDSNNLTHFWTIYLSLWNMLWINNSLCWVKLYHQVL